MHPTYNGLDDKDVRIIRNLYENQVATIRVEGEETEEIKICRGVRQGCVVSPLLFNIYSKAVMSEALEGLEPGVKINGKVVNNLRYADDTVLIASSEQDLQAIVDKVSESENHHPFRVQREGRSVEEHQQDKIYGGL